MLIRPNQNDYLCWMNAFTLSSTVIFDLDGTLIDSLQDLADAMNRALVSNGFSPHPYDAYRLFIGRGMKNLVKDALPKMARTEQQIAHLYEALVREYNKNLLENTVLYEGIPSLLDQLEAGNISMSILSNKSDLFTQKIGEKLLGKWFFQQIVGTREGGPRKPDPTEALNICTKLQVQPDSVLFVGDSSIDMHTAKNAGMTAIGVTWGFRSRNELLEHGADYLIDKPMDLLPFLNIF